MSKFWQIQIRLFHDDVMKNHAVGRLCGESTGHKFNAFRWKESLKFEM